MQVKHLRYCFKDTKNNRYICRVTYVLSYARVVHADVLVDNVVVRRKARLTHHLNTHTRTWNKNNLHENIK